MQPDHDKDAMDTVSSQVSMQTCGSLVDQYSDASHTSDTKSTNKEHPESTEVMDSSKNTICGKIVSCYARFIVYHPWLMLLIVLSAVATFAGVSMAVVGFPKFNEYSEGFEARGSYLADARISFDHLRWTLKPIRYDESERDTTTTPDPITIQETVYNKRGLCFDLDNLDSGVLQKDYMKFVFSGVSDKNLFTVEAMQEMCDYEEQVVQTSPHKHGMEIGPGCRGLSLGHVVGLLAGNKDCMELTHQDVAMVLTRIKTCLPMIQSANEGVNDTECNEKIFDQNIIYLLKEYLVDTEFVQDFTVKYAMVLYPVRYFNSFSFYMDHIDEYKFKGTYVYMVAFGLDKNNTLFKAYLGKDTILLLTGAALILFITILYTRSIILSIAMIFGIIFSFLTPYFIYCVILGIEFFPFYNVLSIVVLIAIGADDVFIFSDIWSQQRIIHVENSSHNNITNIDRCVILTKTLSHAALSIFLTTISTASAFLTNIWNIVSVMKCFGLYSALCILCCFCFVLSWIPAVIIIIDQCTQKCNSSCVSWKCFEKSNRFFKNLTFAIFGRMLPYVINKMRWFWVVSLTLLGGGALFVIFVNPGLHAPTSDYMDFFTKHNFIVEYDNSIIDKFHFSKRDRVIHLSYVFGVIGTDNGNYFNPYNKGHLVLDQGFKFSDPDVINFLTSFCEDLLHATFLSNESISKSTCLLSHIKDAMTESCGDNNPVRAPCCGQSWPLPSDEFDFCLPMIVQNIFQILPSNVLGIPFIDDKLKIKAFVITFKTSQSMTASFEPMNAIYKTTRNFLDTRLSKDPNMLQSGFVTYHGYLLYFDLQRSLYVSTLATVGLSLACALAVMFLSTFSLLISVYAVLSIALAVSVTVGILVLSGWELNILESFIMAIAIGLSIDFTIHYGTAYLISKEANRSDRVRESFITVGPAVVMAALTSFVAGLPSVFAILTSLLKLGIFLMLVMVCSWVYATFLFQSLCHLIGPKGNPQNEESIQCSLAGFIKKHKLSQNLTSGKFPSMSDGQYISKVECQNRQSCVQVEALASPKR